VRVKTEASFVGTVGDPTQKEKQIGQVATRYTANATMDFIQTDRRAIGSMPRRHECFLGWTAVGLSTVAACYWAVWGTLENFHEGWWYPSLWVNLGLMLAQYLLPMLLFVGAGLTAIYWPRIGGGIHVAAALVAAWFFRGATPIVLYPFMVGPLTLMGILYWFGRTQPRRWAVAAVAGFPLVTVLVCGVGPAYRVAGRLDDGGRAARRLEGNGVDLIWAPEGPGWPRDGVAWEEAMRRCRHLTEDGSSLAESRQHVWRLPTVDEAVRSLQRHGENCGGSWDAARSKPAYQRMPDKESPLWDVHSQVIYWWTETEVNEREAYIIVYNGQVYRRPKHAHWGYLGFRAVKESGRHLAPVNGQEGE
jgi:hypothetical protein